MANGYWQSSGGGGGGGAGYLGQVASQSAMTALSSAAVGDECLRTDLGTGGLRYELTALPASTAANWQPVQGTLADGSLVTVALVDGKMPRRLQVLVPTGNQVTVTVGGVTLPVLVASASPHVVEISDEPGVASPTSVTVQRTSGSDATGWFSLEG